MTNTNNPIPDDKKVDHLFLLVGGNPLPNAVAGKLLVKPGGTIYLVHSRPDTRTGSWGTGDVANRLAGLLSDYYPETIEVSDSNSGDIRNEIAELLESVGEGMVGLNYTGGTKAMAVHTYLAIKAWAKETQQTPIYSYLDPRTLRMRFDEDGSCYVALAEDARVNLADLIYLHGDLVIDAQNRPRNYPMLPATANYLAKTVIQGKVTNRSWNTWLSEYIYPLKLENSIKRKWGYQNWEDEQKLLGTTIAWPKPDGLGDLLRQELEEVGCPIGMSHLNLKEVRNTLQLEHTEYFCAWLVGQWLENHVLDTLQKIQEKYHFHELAMNVKPTDMEGVSAEDDSRFEIDVVGIRGYQLFGISCSTTEKKGQLKQKLFEALIRSRQLGGDEARVALVCGSEEPRILEEEVKRTIDPHVKVFGKGQLRNLEKWLAQWINQEKGKEGD